MGAPVQKSKGEPGKAGEEFGVAVEMLAVTIELLESAFGGIDTAMFFEVELRTADVRQELERESDAGSFTGS